MPVVQIQGFFKFCHIIFIILSLFLFFLDNTPNLKHFKLSYVPLLQNTSNVLSNNKDDIIYHQSIIRYNMNVI